MFLYFLWCILQMTKLKVKFLWLICMHGFGYTINCYRGYNRRQTVKIAFIGYNSLLPYSLVLVCVQEL